MYRPEDTQLIEKVNFLAEASGRKDIGGQILEEIVRKNTKLNDTEIELAKLVLVPAWKFAWRKIKNKFKIGNPTAN